MFGSLSVTEIMLILVIALIIFGPRKLPQLGKTLGQSLAQFRRASEDFKRTWESEVTMEEKRVPETTAVTPSVPETAAVTPSVPPATEQIETIPEGDSSHPAS